MQHRHNAKRTQLLKERAHDMRNTLTFSERCLWAELRGCRLGVQFRRQVPIGRYIVDFLAPSVRLIVEVDGGYHQRRPTADARRDAFLARQGYRVLRLSDELVVRQRPVAVARVRSALAELPAP